jgi:lipoprotein-releasing system permease protein
LLGCIIGVITAKNVNNIISGLEWLFQFEVMPKSVYYISEIHGVVDWSYVIAVCFSSFFITLLATLYPASRAARVQPAQALRYE